MRKATSRITVDLDAEQAAMLKYLKKTTRATSVDLFRRGLHLLDMVVQAERSGKHVEITDGKGNGTRLTFLF